MAGMAEQKGERLYVFESYEISFEINHEINQPGNLPTSGLLITSVNKCTYWFEAGQTGVYVWGIWA